MARSDEQRLEALAGRSRGERSDSRDTHARLIQAVSDWVAVRGTAPERLADLAEAAGVATATAYRHFASADDAIQAFVLQLPVRAVELFEASDRPGSSPVERLRHWNQSWVTSCREHGPLAVNLRSPRGFLERRANNDPVIRYACSRIEPLLEDLDGDTTLQLFTWNLTSDPREVLDLLGLGWTEHQIAEFITQSTLATPRRPDASRGSLRIEERDSGREQSSG